MCIITSDKRGTMTSKAISDKTVSTFDDLRAITKHKAISETQKEEIILFKKSLRAN